MCWSCCCIGDRWEINNTSSFSGTACVRPPAQEYEVDYFSRECISPAASLCSWSQNLSPRWPKNTDQIENGRFIHSAVIGVMRRTVAESQCPRLTSHLGAAYLCDTSPGEDLLTASGACQQHCASQLQIFTPSRCLFKRHGDAAVHSS